METCEFFYVKIIKVRETVYSMSVRFLRHVNNIMKISNIEEYKLEINNKEQIIQGIYILGKEVYQQIRFVVEMEHLEGWNPTRNDIQYLLDTVKHPNPKLDVEIDKLFGDRVDER